MSEDAFDVLELLLEHQPALLSVDEVIRAMTAGAEEFAPRDRVENALRDLVAVGLAHRLGAFVFATRAAVWLRALDER